MSASPTASSSACETRACGSRIEAIRTGPPFSRVRCLRRFRVHALCVLVCVAACNVYVYPPAQPGAAPSRPTAAADPDAGEGDGADEVDAENDDPFEPWDEVLEDTHTIEGYFTFHLKRDNTLFLELRPEQLDRDFGLAMYVSRGVGDFNLHEGLPLSEMRLMRFRRVGDDVYLIERNPRFTADEGSPMRISLDENIGHSVAAAFDIQSENEDTKHLLLDVTEFIVSDYANVADQVRLYYGNQPITFDEDRSHVAQVLGFPRNVEIDAALTFRASDPPAVGGAALSDWRSIPIGVRYSFVALPERPMRPRLADDRIGHFITVLEDFSRDRTETQYVRYVNRWRLRKRQPRAEISAPIRPIVFYIDRSVPHEYRRYVREGIEAWNVAFRAAGFRHAIVARAAPADPDWSAEDVRYSTVRWTASHRMAYAIGPSQTDPRTGEILNADILIPSNLPRLRLLEYQERVAPTAVLRGLLGMAGFDRTGRNRFCFAAAGTAHQLAFQYAALVGLGVLQGGAPLPAAYIGAAIRSVVMHEVGHALGLRHNFKASSGIPYERLNDEAFTRAHGLTLSVMDYGAVNIALDPERQGLYWNQGIGSYDAWAIQYAYAPVYEQAPDTPFAFSGELVDSPQDELVGLRKLAEQAADPLHAYGTDEDAMLGVFTVDPLTNAWDLGSDPLAYAHDRIALTEKVQPRLEAGLIEEGEGYARLRGAVAGLIFERLLVLIPATRMVGGVYVVRDHKGDPGARPPLVPVPADRQRQAVQLLIEQALTEEAFHFPPDLLAHLAPNRWSHWGVGQIRIPVDFPVHGYVAMMQRILLEELLDPARIARVIDNEARVPAGSTPYRASQLFRTVSNAVWAELGVPPAGVVPPDGKRSSDDARTASGAVRAASDDASSASNDARTASAGGPTGQPSAEPPRSIDSFRRNLQRAHVDALVQLLLTAEPPVLWFAPSGDARALARLELVRLSERIDAALAAGGSLDTYTRAHLAEIRARIRRALEARLVLPPR